MFLNNVFFLQGGFVSTSPNPQAGGPPLVGCPRLLNQFIRSYPHYWRPFLYPQPENAPCRGDGGPTNIELIRTPLFNVTSFAIYLSDIILKFYSTGRILFQGKHLRILATHEPFTPGNSTLLTLNNSVALHPHILLM